MSIFGTGTSDFAALSGEEIIETGQFNDIEVYNNIYLKEATDTYTGYNVPLITTNKTNDDMIFNTTTLSSNWDFTVGTGETTKESIFRINPTTGLHFEANNNPVNIDWNELSYLNGARSNIQAQLDNLDPDLSSNQGYWGNFWNPNTLTNPSANNINIVSFPNSDTDNYGFSISNSNRIVAGQAGIYMFIATIQINKSQGSTQEDVFFWIRKNGVDIADSAFKDSIKSEPKLICANWQVKLQATEYIQIAWSSPDIHVQLVAYTAGSTPTKPAIPSVILTASQVSFLVDGGASLLPFTYNTSTNVVNCDASLNVNGFITTNQHPRYTGATPFASTSTNDYVPRIYISNNFVAKAGNESINGVKTWNNNAFFLSNVSISRGSLDVSGNITVLKGNTSIRYLKTNGNYDCCGNIVVDGSMNVNGNTSLRNLKTSGNIDCCGNLVVDCSSVVWQGTRNYGYYNLVSYIQDENVATRNRVDFVETVANNAVSIGTNAQNTANQAISDANGAWNRAGDAQDRADDAYDLAATAQATGAAAATVAAGAAAVGATNAAAITGLTTSLATLSGTVGGIQTDLIEEQTKTQFMLPVDIGNLRSRFINKVALFQSELSISPDIVLDPFGKSTFYQELETTQKMTARNLDLTAGQVQNLRGSTVNIGDSGGAINADSATVSVGNVPSSTVQIGSSSSTINANVASLNLGNEALSTITIGSSTSTVNANVSSITLGNVAASNVRLGSSSSNIYIGGLTSATYINGFLYVPFNPANFTSILSQWS